MSVKKEYSEALDLLRFPLAIIVMVVHMFGAIDPAVFGAGDKRILELAVNCVDGFLRGQSVPIYFFIAGYVFFAGVDWGISAYLRKLRNRVHTLLIPYLLWNTLAIGIFLVQYVPAIRRFLPIEYELHTGLSDILACYWMYNNQLTPDAGSLLHPYYPLNIPLWFIRDLMLVVLFTPLLYFILRRIGFFFLIFLSVIYLGLQFIEDGGHIHLLVVATLFFSWGGYISIQKRNLLTEFSRYKYLALAIYLLSSVVYVACVHYWPVLAGVVKSVGVVAGLLVAYNLASYLTVQKKWRANRFLAASSFFIYVSHTLFCMKFVRLLEWMFAPSEAFQVLLIYGAALLFCLFFLLSLYWLMHRYMTGVLLFLTGRK